jgi:hypothetical protein
MTTIVKAICRSIVVLTFVGLSFAENSVQPYVNPSLVIIFKDGQQRSFSVADVVRIDFGPRPVVVLKDGRRESFSAADLTSMEFNSSIGKVPPGRNHFVGKWEVGEGNGINFFITLEPDGSARKTIGSSHGTWSLIDGEARIAWDDGWHDAIRKIGSKHEKRAYAPGKSFSDEPSNVTDARNTNPQPI